MIQEFRENMCKVGVSRLESLANRGILGSFFDRLTGFDIKPVVSDLLEATQIRYRCEICSGMLYGENIDEGLKVACEISSSCSVFFRGEWISDDEIVSEEFLSIISDLKIPRVVDFLVAPRSGLVLGVRVIDSAVVNLSLAPGFRVKSGMAEFEKLPVGISDVQGFLSSR